MLNEEEKNEIKELVISILEERGLINRRFVGDFIKENNLGRNKDRGTSN